MRLIPCLVDERRAAIAAIAALCERSSACRLNLFGSAARQGFDAERSDLDFMVLFKDMPPAAYS